MTLECVVCGESPKLWALELKALSIGLCDDCCELAKFARDVDRMIDAVPENVELTPGMLQDMALSLVAQNRRTDKWPKRK